MAKKSSEVKYKGLSDYRRSGLNNKNTQDTLKHNSKNAHENRKDFKFFEKTFMEDMSCVRWEVIPGSRRSNGERAVAECRVSTWHSDGQRLCRPQTGSVACDRGRNDELGEIRWCLSMQTAVDQHA